MAALSIFTRLPFWRLCRLELTHYEKAVPYWPLAGWVTGGAMVAAYSVATQLGIGVGTAVAMAIATRVVLTGGLHEDGLADMCDGFGGGTTRERTLEIMKDSHIGSYGVIGLILYHLLLWNLMTAAMETGLPPMVMMVADVYSKACSSLVVAFLQYARKSEEAKLKFTYAQTGAGGIAVSLMLSLPAMAMMTSLAKPDAQTLTLFATAGLASTGSMTIYMRHKIGGYTGDCCGATFLVTEIATYIALTQWQTAI